MPPKKAAKGTKAKASKAGTGAKKKTVKKATAKKSVAAEPSKEEEAPAAAAAPSAPAKPEPASRFATLVAEGSDGGIAKIVLTDLNDAIDVILAAGKTPLLLDNDRKTVETFFSYSSGVMIDCKAIALADLRGSTTEAEREKARAKLVAAMFRGYTCVMAMSNSAPSFKSKICEDTTLPLAVFNQTEFDKEDVWRKLTRDREADTMVFGASGSEYMAKHPDFKLVVLSSFEPEDALEFLGAEMPLEHCCVVSVLNES